jgi:hypothetical protein
MRRRPRRPEKVAETLGAWSKASSGSPGTMPPVQARPCVTAFSPGKIGDTSMPKGDRWSDPSITRKASPRVAGSGVQSGGTRRQLSGRTCQVETALPRHEAPSAIPPWLVLHFTPQSITMRWGGGRIGRPSVHPQVGEGAAKAAHLVGRRQGDADRAADRH